MATSKTNHENTQVTKGAKAVRLHRCVIEAKFLATGRGLSVLVQADVHSRIGTMRDFGIEILAQARTSPASLAS
jgi:hypothetical protein